MSLDLAARTRTTTLLQSHDLVDAETVTGLVPLIYDELRAMAHWQLAREGLEPTLQTTELVHEAYLRLVDDRYVTRRGRAYFFAAASHATRAGRRSGHVERARARTQPDQSVARTGVTRPLPAGLHLAR